MITHASTFSGIGGPEIAASMLGWENVFHCEIQDFPRRVLQYHYPNAKSYEDITKTDFSEWRGKVTVLSGGFPCQPFSYAGKRRGSEDDRYLWPYMLRCIGQVRPAWFVGENVAGITTMALPGKDAEVGSEANIFGQTIHMERREQYVLHAICQQLQDIGYSVQPIVVPACAVAAPHRRDRVFIIAHDEERAESHGSNGFPQPGERRDTAQRHNGLSEVQGFTANNNNNRLEFAIYGGAEREIPQPQAQGGQDGLSINIQQSETACRGVQTAGHLPNAHIEGLEGMHDTRSEEGGGQKYGELLPDTVARIYATPRACSAMAAPFTENTGKNPKPELGGADCQSLLPENRWKEFPTQSPVHRGNDGLPFDVDSLAISFPKWRNESLKAYGNAIVPQVIYMIYEAIDKIEKGLILPD